MQRRAFLIAAVTLFVGTSILKPASAQAPNPTGLGLSNIIQSVSVVNGQLVATTTQGQQLPITLSTSPRQGQAAGCPILNLHLGPINLNLLGLKVDTSEICLKITAIPGQGNLLGNLLCSIAGLLDRGTPLSQILSGLTQTQLNQLLNGLRDLLNGALNNLNQATVRSITPAQVGSCAILNLALGPLDLNLLGLRVQLNNCANPAGPVTVTVTAVPGPGNLLGNLLCGLLGNISIGTTLQQILQQVLQAILGALSALPPV